MNISGPWRLKLAYGTLFQFWNCIPTTYDLLKARKEEYDVRGISNVLKCFITQCINKSGDANVNFRNQIG